MSLYKNWEEYESMRKQNYKGKQRNKPIFALRVLTSLSNCDFQIWWLKKTYEDKIKVLGLQRWEMY